MDAPPRLHPDDLDQLADLIAERVAARLISDDANDHLTNRPFAAVEGREKQRKAPERLLSAREVAGRYGVSAEWVRDHASDLGAIRLGDGPRPRLRFDPEIVAGALTSRSGRERSEVPDLAVATGVGRSRRSKKAGNGLDSLPLRELQPRPTSRKATPAALERPGVRPTEVRAP